MEKSLSYFNNSLMKLRVYIYDLLKMVEKNDSNDNENSKNKDDDKIQKENKCKNILFLLDQLNKNFIQIKNNEIS